MDASDDGGDGGPPRLVVVGTPIGNVGDLSPRAAAALREADLVLAEDTRHTGQLLARLGIDATLRSSHAHNELARRDEVVDRIAAGEVVALVSDAGMPSVSDPGQAVVEAVAAAGHRVEVVPGPSAVTTALVGSGLPAERWTFDGFLPRKGAARRERLAELAAEARTMVLFVAPHHAARDLADLAEALGEDRPAALGRELTKRFEEVLRGRLGELAARAADGLRGELTLVVAGAPAAAPAEVDDDELAAAVAERMAAGERRKDAASAVAERFGVGRKRAYDASLSLG